MNILLTGGAGYVRSQTVVVLSKLGYLFARDQQSSIHLPVFENGFPLRVVEV
jgi:UDP-glucose 4-epimerase